MAQKQTFVFKSINSTRLLNDHIAKIIAEGPYNGLMIVPTVPRSMSVGLTAGYALTNEGVKIEETNDQGIELGEDPAYQNDLKFITLEEPNQDYPRRDLIVLRHRYRTYAANEDPAEDPNIARYVVIPGTPTPFSEGAPKVREDAMEEGDIPLAEIVVSPGMQAISDADIFNRTRTMNATELMKQVSKALYIGMGNFVYEGWDLTANALNVTVSPGVGLLCGSENTSGEDFVLTTIRAREFLYYPQDYVESTLGYTGAFRHVGDNLTLDKQPDYPSKLKIRITPMGAPIENTTIFVTGKDANNNIIDAEPVPVNCPNVGVTYEFETTSYFKIVDHEGIDAHLLENIDATARIHVCDSPKGYIYAVGTNSGRPQFEVFYSIPDNLPCNYLYLGYALSDETKIYELKKENVAAFTDVVEDLSDQANGVNKVFHLKESPKPGTEFVMIDGLVLMPNSPHGKGYVLRDGNIIELQENVLPPDGMTDMTGSGPCDVWVRYKHQ